MSLTIKPSASVATDFTLITVAFDVQPPGNTWTIEVGSTAIMESGGALLIPGAGIFTVTAIISPTLVAVNYPVLPQNTHDGDTIPVGTLVVPSASGLRVSPGCAVESLDAPELGLSIDSEIGSIVLEWLQTAAPTNNEISISQNGGSYSVLATQDGALLEYEDTGSIGSGDVWCYRVKGISGSIESDYSNVACAVRDMIFLGTAVSQPTWQIAFGDFASDDPSNLTSAQFPGLKRVTGNLYMDTCTALVSYDFSGLFSVGGTVSFAFSGMATLSLQSLNEIDGVLELGLMPNLTTLSLPSLVTVNGDINCDSSTNLANVDLSSLIMQNGRNYRFDSCALTAAAVNHILARAVASGVTSASIVTDNGTSAAPTGQGILDKAALLLAGNNVDTN